MSEGLYQTAITREDDHMQMISVGVGDENVAILRDVDSDRIRCLGGFAELANEFSVESKYLDTVVLEVRDVDLLLIIGHIACLAELLGGVEPAQHPLLIDVEAEDAAGGINKQQIALGSTGSRGDFDSAARNDAVG